MRLNLLIGLFSLFIITKVTAQNEAVPIPTPAQLTWQDAELTAIFHYDLHVFDGVKYNQKHNRTTL